MLLLVGLGNPGPEYARHRHNIGFMAVDAIVRRHSFAPFKKKFQGQVAEGDIAGVRVLALKPQTFMNESGRSVGAAMAFYKIQPEDVIVFHDEIDLLARKVRVKKGGGHAGHNGLRSIHEQIGPDYRRVRLGIGHPGDRNRVTGHVLGPFSKEDQEWLEKLLAALAEHAGLLVKGDDGGYMSKVANDIKPPRPAAPKPDAKPADDKPADEKPAGDKPADAKPTGKDGL
ncbi:MAG TPA: aminoacyl-tRNA hydrolase [Rhodospirillales bacterium]|jgi:PTH1 family peptidyl-tRNA hydrolase